MAIKIPASLISHSLVQSLSFSPAVGNFFGYSCVPGVKDPQHDPRGNNPKNLCEACIGDENDRHICANSHRERHYGEAGALRSVRRVAVKLTGGGSTSSSRSCEDLEETPARCHFPLMLV